MSARTKWVFILLLLDFQFVMPQNELQNIQDLIHGSNPPLVVLLNAAQRHGAIYDLAEVDSSTSLEEKPDDEGAYFLFHILRTTQENEVLDPEADRTFEKTKAILGEALRARCNRYERCVKRCVKKRYTCTVSCREEYDVYEVCEQVIVCKTCSKGKTMPPYWLL